MRRRISAALFGTGLVAALLVALGASQPAQATPIPGYSQVVTVYVAHATDTVAQLDMWSRAGTGVLTHVGGPFYGRVGALGVGAAREGISRTPAGLFSMTEAFGNQPNNGTRLPYFQAGPYDWWNEESGSPNYNNHVYQTYSPGPNSENLYYAGGVYAHAVVINYNRFPAVPGMGSGFFLHVSNGQPTAGCVSMVSAQLDTVMRWLNPALHPVISIGVGQAAFAPISQSQAAAAAGTPRGHLDLVAQYPAAGWVRVAGWAVDPDNTRYPLSISIYSDGRSVALLQLGVARPDVARILGAGPDQGFDHPVYVGTGTHRVCAVAHNVGYGLTNPTIGCYTVTVH